MKIKIERSMKIRLLEAIKTGYLETDTIPELFEIAPQSIKTMTREQLEAEIKRIQKLRNE